MKIPPLRTAKALFSLARLVRDPTRLNEVFEMSDALATPDALRPMLEALAADPAVAPSLEARHRIRISIPELRELRPGTLGRSFAEHMIRENLDPSALPTLPSDTPAAFFRAHLYETHDVWHVATGFGTDFVGELGLQGFYLAQIPGPLPSLLVAVGFLRSAIYDHDLTLPFVEAFVHGWTQGRRAKPLFGVRWDEMWDLPLPEVRRRLALSIRGAEAESVALVA